MGSDESLREMIMYQENEYKERDKCIAFYAF